MHEQLFHVGVKALILDDKKNILLLRVNPKNLKFPDKAFWDIPGGRVREKQLEETLLEELKEETALDKKDINLGKVFSITISHKKNPTDIKGVKLALVVFLCKLRNKDKKIKLSIEHTECKWVPIGEAKRLLAYKYPKSFTDSLGELG
ncbi:MAG: NUDIX domain-containing protein [Candidatus Aenigmarchaeota archaeon]|nr:NUDIX domain-containing protein [Candidatus Aenigmarchaeota archaeon]